MDIEVGRERKRTVKIESGWCDLCK